MINHVEKYLGQKNNTETQDEYDLPSFENVSLFLHREFNRQSLLLKDCLTEDIIDVLFTALINVRLLDLDICAQRLRE